MSFDIELVARTVWMEARGEGPLGISAVAWTIVNRKNAQRWFSAKTLAGCCLLPAQFSCWNTNDANRAAMCALPDADPILALCRTAVVDAASSTNPHDDPTGGATHYYDDRMRVPPSWSIGQIPCAHIGHHRFYKQIE